MGIFYWQLLPHPPVDDLNTWFVSTFCGKNTLSKVVSKMFTEAGVTKKKSDHGFRAAGVTRLFEAGVDEKSFSHSGHQSINAFRF